MNYQELWKQVKEERDAGKVTKKQKFVMEAALREKWREDGTKCIKCPNLANTVDHIISDMYLSQFGINITTHFDEDNLAPMCERCNRFKMGRLDFTIPRTKELLLKYVNQIL